MILVFWMLLFFMGVYREIAYYFSETQITSDYNDRSSDIALYSGYYGKNKESIEKNFCAYILRKPKVRLKKRILKQSDSAEKLKRGKKNLKFGQQHVSEQAEYF